MCVLLERRAFKNLEMCVLLKWRAQKRMNLSTITRPASCNEKNSYYSFKRSTPHFWLKGLLRANKICVSLRFWAIDATFLTKRLRTGKLKFAFRCRFERSTPRFWRKGLPRANTNLCFAAVWDEKVAHEQINLRFATVLGQSLAIATTVLTKGLISGRPRTSRPALE